jgi:hypothetical protein
LNSGEKLFFGRGNYFTFPDIHPNGWTVRKLRGTSNLFSRLLGCLHHCLATGQHYDEATAFPNATRKSRQAA